MVLCFFLTRESFVFSVKTVIVGVKRRMEGLLGKHMSVSRLVKYVKIIFIGLAIVTICMLYYDLLVLKGK